MRTRRFLAAVAVCASFAARLGAQNPADHPEQYAAADIAAGAVIYSRTCANCHGLSGTGVGGIDLHRGLLPRARTDAALRTVITTGFPQAGMPPFRMTEDELRAVVAFVRAGWETTSDPPPVTPGDVARGKALTEGKGACLSCHRVNDRGSFSGPDLTDIGRARSLGSIWKSLVDPSASMRPINRPVRVVMKDGKVVTGRRLNEDTYTVQLMGENGQLIGLVKSELKEYAVGTTSPMPSFKNTLTAPELADVLAYMFALKGQ